VGRFERLTGTISAFGLPDGDRIVVGAWWRSPLGTFADVMWARPDGVRVLLAPDQRVADYVSGIYDFDRIAVVPFDWTATPSSLTLRAGDLDVVLSARGGGRVPFPRPRWCTRWVEAPIARRLLGVEIHGVSPRDVEEWYQARAWRWIDDARILVAGHPQPGITPPRPPLHVGFSEPPPRPSITALTVQLRRRIRSTPG
jgi:hypothetical protein